MPQLVGKIHMDLMGVYQTFCLIPQGIQLLFAVFPDLHDLGRMVYADPILEYGDHDLLHSVGSRSQQRLFPGCHRIEQQRGPGTVPAMGPDSGQTENFWMNLQKRI